MFTVKHIDYQTSTESVYCASRVTWQEGGDVTQRGLAIFAADRKDPLAPSEYFISAVPDVKDQPRTGVAYVMNESGKTVATYHL